MKQENKCPWNTRPKNVEEMLQSCREQGDWEDENETNAPIHWCIVPTRQFMQGLCARLILNETRVERLDNEMKDAHRSIVLLLKNALGIEKDMES